MAASRSAVGDADRIAPHLWQGALPASGTRVPFDVVVNLTGSAARFPGARVLWAPMRDSVEIPDNAMKTAARVADLVRAGKRVLVACVSGHNRSGLVCALVLWHLAPRKRGVDCLWQVQERRAGALRNAAFAQFLFFLPSRHNGGHGRKDSRIVRGSRARSDLREGSGKAVPGQTP